MKPWFENNSWFSSYATCMSQLKRTSRADLPKVRKAVRSTFTKVYRAVAFDIDGTLTETDGTVINRDMALVVGRLLQRGVPVVLITGRGRKATREAANDIREYANLTGWYLRRLQCITHNGVILLQTPSVDPNAFLRTEIIIEQFPYDIDTLIEVVRQKIAESGLSSRVDVTREPHSLRLVLKARQDLSTLEQTLKKIVLDNRKRGIHLFLSRGSYGSQSCLDLSGTNKDRALAFIANSLGIDSDRILRIGDQGQDGGNDFDLLNSPAGFSVGDFSDNFRRCFPVLDHKLKSQLRGVEATNRLLDLVLLFPPLSIAPSHSDERLMAHRTFEKLALIRSREETETVTQRLRVRLRYLLPDSSGFANSHTLEISDIYDMKSGGVIFRDWELEDLAKDHPVLRLFELPTTHFEGFEEPKAKWCIFTDTGILMRGPCYYFGQTTPLPDRTLPSYLIIAKRFVSQAHEVIRTLRDQDPNLTLYKFALAIQDNVRNILLQLLYVSFVIEGTAAETFSKKSKSLNRGYGVTRRFFEQAVVSHTRHHFDLLLNADAHWRTLLASYSRLLSQLSRLFNDFERRVNPKIEKVGPPEDVQSIGPLFKWRECDNFLQNVTAVQLGLHELYGRPEIREAKSLAVVGLAYGGLELPALAQVVADARGLRLRSAIARVSIYGDKEAGKKIRAGKYQYVTELLNKTKPLCVIDGSNVKIEELSFILMDDNCTTGVTLQLARDFLVMQGADVVGAVVVRFPGANRAVQMAMPGGGFPDPEVLFSFIRGLVAPSPYTRLIYPRRGSRDQYLDQTGIFDKAKERISRYLQKNGTEVLKKTRNSNSKGGRK